jgi:hypothetical protein
MLVILAIVLSGLLLFLLSALWLLSVPIRLGRSVTLYFANRSFYIAKLFSSHWHRWKGRLFLPRGKCVQAHFELGEDSENIHRHKRKEREKEKIRRENLKEQWRRSHSQSQRKEKAEQKKKSYQQEQQRKESCKGEMSPLLEARKKFGIGESDSFTAEELKRRYRQLVMKYHPDRLSGFSEAPEFVELANRKMREINAAYEELKPYCDISPKKAA